MQLVKEFNRCLEAQGKSFQLCKLSWLECVPLILDLSRSEGTTHIRQWVGQFSDSTNEGIIICNMH